MSVCAFWYRLCTESEWGVCVSVCCGIGRPLSHTEVCVCLCVCVLIQPVHESQSVVCVCAPTGCTLCHRVLCVCVWYYTVYTESKGGVVGCMCSNRLCIESHWAVCLNVCMCLCVCRGIGCVLTHSEYCVLLCVFMSASLACTLSHMEPCVCVCVLVNTVHWVTVSYLCLCVIAGVDCVLIHVEMWVCVWCWYGRCTESHWGVCVCVHAGIIWALSMLSCVLRVCM